MRLISWNVNGLRACVQKGFMDFFNSADADCFCLQETKLQPGQIQLDTPAHQQFWYSAEKKGYSGTALFSKAEPLSVRYGLGVPELDTEGRIITAEYPGFFLVTCYTPNASGSWHGSTTGWPGMMPSGAMFAPWTGKSLSSSAAI